MFDLFRRNEAKTNTEPSIAETPEATHVAPGTQISFHPELIDELKSDHQTLVGLYTEVTRAIEAQDYDQASEGLEELRNELQNHLLTENIKLYIYLSHQFENDQENITLIQNFRRENDKIGRAALKFLQQYHSAQEIAAQADTFNREFAELGDVLVQRIEREETILYPLYNQAG